MKIELIKPCLNTLMFSYDLPEKSLEILSSQVQHQLETAVLWDFTGRRTSRRGTAAILPDFPAGAAGDIRSVNDLRTRSLSGVDSSFQFFLGSCFFVFLGVFAFCL